MLIGEVFLSIGNYPFRSRLMIVTATALLKDLVQGKAPLVALADGEEPFDIDRITEAYEILLPAEQRDFNLLVLYGKDVSVATLLSTCRRFPMFAEFQVVILKDASHLDGIADLAPYLEHPAPTTRLLIEHRFKKIDGRNKIVTLARKLPQVAHITTQKIKEEDVPGWIMTWGHNNHFAVGLEEAQLLTSLLGTDVQKIANEIEKVRLNVPAEPALTKALIKRFIGEGRSYNIFEFPDTFTPEGAGRRYAMLAYFISNPKAAPMPLILGTFYNHFLRLYNATFIDEGAPDAAAVVGVPPFRLRATIARSRQIGRGALEEALLVLADTSAKAVGIGTKAGDTELLREFCGRLERALF